MNFLKTYFSPVLKWWWLVASAPVIAAVSAILFVQQLPPVYQARTTLLIGRAFQDPNPSSSEFVLSYQLAGEYANVAMREPVKNSTKAALGISELPKYEATPRGVFLEISVIHTDPAFAQVVANTLAQKLIELSPASVQAANQEDQKFIEQQLRDLQINIEKTKLAITENQEKLSRLESALEIVQTEKELSALEEKLSKLQTLYTNLYASTREAAFNTLSIFEPASLPDVPVGPNKVLIILLAAASGLAFSIGAAYIIEFLDDTIKSSEDVSRITDVPVIGTIADMPQPIVAFVADAPRSHIADAFRSLRTNLEFSSVDHPIRKLVLTSVDASEGKSTVAINLSLVLAQAEKRVVLVDADLRSPSIHKYMDIPGNPGLSDVFLNRISLCEGLVSWNQDINLKILPAGSIPPNSAELLGSRKMEQILEELSSEADIVIIDGPPAFIVDSMVLSAKADGVILVVNSGETHRGPLKALTEQLKRIGANLIGVVLNRVPRSIAYYGGYYYSSYYSEDGKVKKRVKKNGEEVKQQRHLRLRLPNLKIRRKAKMPDSSEEGLELERVEEITEERILSPIVEFQAVDEGTFQSGISVEKDETDFPLIESFEIQSEEISQQSGIQSVAELDSSQVVEHEIMAQAIQEQEIVVPTGKVSSSTSKRRSAKTKSTSQKRAARSQRSNSSPNKGDQQQ